MSLPRKPLTNEDLTGVAQAAFGRSHELQAVERLRGGSKKGVYRLTLDDDTTAIAYVWSADEDFWPHTVATDPAEPFAPATGLALFEAAQATLTGIGIRVPRMLWLDSSQAKLAGGVAVVEDVRGGRLEELITSDPERAQPILRRLGQMTRTMHSHHREQYGRPAAARTQPTIEHLVLTRAQKHLAICARRVDEIAVAEQQITDALHERYAAVTPRTEHGLIHGELGPDHVVIDNEDQPVLIDIEGTMFFDIEWEHAFLELRFNEQYHHLAVDDLDSNRLRLYRLAQYLSLVEGPLRLIDGDFPDRAFMLSIVKDNIGRTLRQLT
jgi:Phosphotransferase enzyme family